MLKGAQCGFWRNVTVTAAELKYQWNQNEGGVVGGYFADLFVHWESQLKWVIVEQLPAVLEEKMATLRDNRAPTMSTWMAAIFIFNLVVGTGALALPAAFQKV